MATIYRNVKVKDVEEIINNEKEMSKADFPNAIKDIEVFVEGELDFLFDNFITYFNSQLAMHGLEVGETRFYENISNKDWQIRKMLNDTSMFPDDNKRALLTASLDILQNWASIRTFIKFMFKTVKALEKDNESKELKISNLREELKSSKERKKKVKEKVEVASVPVTINV